MECNRNTLKLNASAYIYFFENNSKHERLIQTFVQEEYTTCTIVDSPAGSRNISSST